MELVGLPLSDAIAILGYEPRIAETAPPFVPKNRVPVWGELRVLRVSESESGIELLVARELLGEEKPLALP